MTPSQNGNTALDWARSENQEDVVALLKAQGQPGAPKPALTSSTPLKNVAQDRAEEEQIKTGAAAAAGWAQCFAKCMPGGAGS